MIRSNGASVYYQGPKPHLLRPSFLRHSLKSRNLRPQIDLEVVREILAKYGLELTKAPQLPPAGGRSQSLVVHTSGGKKMFKKYKPTVIRPAIVQEHSILNHLAKVDFPSPRLVTTNASETWVYRGEENYALFDFIEDGFQYHKYILLPGQSRQFITIAGQILAKLHDELRDFVPEGYNQNGFKSRTEERRRGLEWYIDRLAYCLETTPQLNGATKEGVTGLLAQRAGYFEHTLTQLDALLKEADLPRWIIHGDYGPYNLLFRKNAPVVILDFEIARLDWRVTEIVDTLWRFCEDSWLGFRFNKIKWLLDAYQTYMPLSQQELQFLPAVWKFLHLRRCIMHWDHYCNTQADFRLAKAQEHLNLVDWMTANQNRIMATLGLTTV